MRHPLLYTFIALSVTLSCNDKGTVALSENTQQPPTIKKESGDTVKEVPCADLFASHGRCFVPSKEKIYNIPLGSSPKKGGKTPLVTIVEFTDFECPACQGFTNERLPPLLKKYGDDLAVVMKHYPLSYHKGALTASLASLEVLAQKGESAFWAFHDVMFKGNPAGMTPAWIRAEAQKLGLDMKKYDTALSSGAHKQVLKKDMDLARETGLEGTPWIFVNGRLARKKPVEVLVSEALAEAKKAVSDGTPRERIYSFITDHGKLVHERTIPAATYQDQLKEFKSGFLTKCNNKSKEFTSFYGIVYSCSQKQKKCDAFMKCIEDTIYKK